MSNTINKNVTCFRKLCNLAAMEGYNKNAVSFKVWKDRTVKETDKRAERRNGSPLFERNKYGEVIQVSHSLNFFTPRS